MSLRYVRELKLHLLHPLNLHWRIPIFEIAYWVFLDFLSLLFLLLNLSHVFVKRLELFIPVLLHEKLELFLLVLLFLLNSFFYLASKLGCLFAVQILFLVCDFNLLTI